MDGVILQPETPDKHRWKLTQNGSYTSKSAYASFFVGFFWKTWGHVPYVIKWMKQQIIC